MRTAVCAAIVVFAAAASDLFQQGADLFSQGRFAEAAGLFEQASRATPRDARVWKALGASYAASGDYERANAPLEKACTLDSSLDDACYFYGRNLYALNRFEPALGALGKALRSDRRPWRVHLAIAQASEALERPEAAEAAFRKAISLYQPGNTTADFDPRLHYAVFLFRQGRVDEARGPAMSVVEAWPKSGRAHFELGRVLEHQGKLEAAASELELAVAGGYGQAHLLLGRIYARLGRNADAQRHLELARGQVR